MLWNRDLDLKVTGATKVKFSFGSISQSFRVINLKLGTGTCLGSVMITIHFGVTGAKFRVTGVTFASLEHN